MRVLVTGAAGFVGSHLCERLVADGHEVIGLDAFVPYYPRAVKERNLARLREARAFRFVEGDLTKVDLTPLVADVDAVIHEAALAGNRWDLFDLYVACNITATQRLLEAIRAAGEIERRRFVHISTSSVYGAEARGDETTPLRPVSPYGVTKLAAEKLALAYHDLFGLPVVVLRYFSNYGPRQRPDMAYHIFIAALLRGEPITILGDGEQTRSNTYIDDCVAGTILGLAKGRAGEVYNIGGGVSVSVNEVLATLEDLTERRAERAYGPARLGDQRHTLADVTKARAELGYAPRIAPADGLRAQVEWQRALVEEALAR